jgi:hypothetical protein
MKRCLNSGLKKFKEIEASGRKAFNLIVAGGGQDLNNAV